MFSAFRFHSLIFEAVLESTRKINFYIKQNNIGKVSNHHFQLNYLLKCPKNEFIQSSSDSIVSKNSIKIALMQIGHRAILIELIFFSIDLWAHKLVQQLYNVFLSKFRLLVAYFICLRNWFSAFYRIWLIFFWACYFLFAFDTQISSCELLMDQKKISNRSKSMQINYQNWINMFARPLYKYLAILYEKMEI